MWAIRGTPGTPERLEKGDETGKSSRDPEDPAGTATGLDGDRDRFIEDLRDVLYAAKIVAYAQGFALMREAAASSGRSSWERSRPGSGTGDLVGTHIYERIDKARGKFFHTNWTARGGGGEHLFDEF